MIAIIGHMDFEPSARDRIVDATAELQRRTREEEPGCRVYAISADPAHPGRVLITELWETSAALDAHFAHPNFANTGAIMRSEERLDAAVRKYRIDAEADVIGSDGVPFTAFD